MTAGAVDPWQALVDSRMGLLSDEDYGIWRSRSNVKACLTGETFQVLRNVNPQSR